MKDSVLLNQFYEWYIQEKPHAGLRVQWQKLILHGTTIAEDCELGRVCVRPLPSGNPELWQDIHIVLSMLAYHLESTGDNQVWLRKKPLKDMWYWLNGNEAGEEV